MPRILRDKVAVENGACGQEGGKGGGAVPTFGAWEMAGFNWKWDYVICIVVTFANR
jgi:hypothetical protein